MSEQKTWAYRLFRVGAVPRRQRRRLLVEGIRVCEEGVRAVATWRGVRLPGRRVAWRRQKVSAALVVTNRSVAAYTGPVTLFRVSTDEAGAEAVSASVDTEGRVRITLNVGALHTGGRGTIEYVFRVDSAYRIVDAVNSAFNDM